MNDSFEFYPVALEHCRLCPRLAEYRERVATEKRRAYREQPYWGKPVPGFGDPDARILLLGLAPGAHGSNRTGRMFTGDAGGGFLYPALHRAGLANKPVATSCDDGLKLSNVFITSACRCVPPGNRPPREEIGNCRRWLVHDFHGLPHLKIVVALGRIGHGSYLDYLKAEGRSIIKNRYPFAHGALHRFDNFDNVLPLLDCYHVSFQNTNTGKLTAIMLDTVLLEAKHLAAVA
jgi:uracil-DNA glycosylase family 4